MEKNLVKKLVSVSAVTLLSLSFGCRGDSLPPPAAPDRTSGGQTGSGGSSGSGGSGEGGSSANGGSTGAASGGSAGAATGGTTGATGGSTGVANGGSMGTGGSSAGGSSGTGGSAAGPDAGTGGASTGGTTGTGGSTTAPAPDAAPPELPPATPLPLVVTDHYNNQGWFGDSSVMEAFSPTLIKQGTSTTGLCGKRVANAKGNCLEIIYTPPSTVMAPATGTPFVGVFFLTTLTGSMQPNWGDEPGKRIAPGAKKISFSAAAATAGLNVAFKAGAGSDPFMLMDQVETLSASWTTRTVSLEGLTYDAVLGSFAWILTDTTKPATFYLDNIVWE